MTCTATSVVNVHKIFCVDKELKKVNENMKTVRMTPLWGLIFLTLADERTARPKSKARDEIQTGTSRKTLHILATDELHLTAEG